MIRVYQIFGIPLSLFLNKQVAQSHNKKELSDNILYIVENNDIFENLDINIGNYLV